MEGKHLHILRYTLTEQILHGMEVSNLAYDLGKEIGMSEEECYELALAGLVHDIGKIPLNDYARNYDDTLVVEELRFVRAHSELSYEILKKRGYPAHLTEMILHHHENMDGSGYPEHLAGEKIPLGARILRICDVYCALTSDRPYRQAFDSETAIELMIDEIQHFDIQLFLIFQRVVHDHPQREISLEYIDGLIKGEIENGIKKENGNGHEGYSS